MEPSFIDVILLSIHPGLQLAVLLYAFLVTGQGLARFQALHLGRPTIFAWKSHVRGGSVVFLLWLAGSLTGGLAMRLVVGPSIFKGPHFTMALSIIPLVLIGLATGIFLNVRKKKRVVVPVLHGMNNLVLMALVIDQASVGMQLWWALMID